MSIELVKVAEDFYDIKYQGYLTKEKLGKLHTLIDVMFMEESKEFNNYVESVKDEKNG